MRHNPLSPPLEDCIVDCLSCGQTCSETLARHCLEVGGKHVEPTHVRLMMDCSEICTLAANYMIRASQFHEATCRICADVCRACAASCREIGDMDACVEACNRCADTCSSMTA